jgi:hypothetical protein
MTMTSRQRTTRPRKRRAAEDAPPSDQTVQISTVEPEPEMVGAEPATPKPEPSRPARRGRLWRVGAGVWIGLLLTAGGFGLIAFTWGKTAALINVAEQIPYLVSGGLSGLGLILLGLLVVNLSAKRREAAERARQLEEVRDALVQLRKTLEGEPESES